METGVLTAGAALVGLAIAARSIALVTTYGVDYVPRLDEVRLSGPVLSWLAGLALLSGLIIGLVPAVHSSRLRLDRALSSGGRSATDGPAARRLRRALVAAEFALATPLIVAAALVMTSLDRLSRVPVGIDTGRVLTAAVSLPASRYPGDSDRQAFWKRALRRLTALPGVEAAALADSRPPREAGDINNFDLEAHPTPAGQNQPVCPWVGASPGFFKAVGLPLERGRLLDEHSLQDEVIVVDRAWADRFFPREEVLGRRLKGGGCTSCPWTTIVGVVATVKFVGLDAPDQGTVYYLFVDLRDGYVVLRTQGDPSSLTADLRTAVRELDPNLALSNIATGDELVADSLASPRYVSVLIGMFALAAVVLSVVGIYGVMAHFVEQHTRDIGIRLALGGDPSAMRRMVVLQGLRFVVSGFLSGQVRALSPPIGRRALIRRRSCERADHLCPRRAGALVLRSTPSTPSRPRSFGAGTGLLRDARRASHHGASRMPQGANDGSGRCLGSAANPPGREYPHGRGKIPTESHP